MYFGFALDASGIDLRDIDLLDIDLDLLDTDIPSKSPRRLISEDISKTFWRRLQDMYSRRLQHNNFSSSKTSLKTKTCYAKEFLKTSSRHFLKTSSRRLEDQKCLLGLVFDGSFFNIAQPFIRIIMLSE